ncbi:MAG TPA: FtsX-like permease family protein [Cellulomonas sp.]
MRPADVVRRAVSNAFRSRLRTGLTVLAIVIGAFTLALTNGLGTGISTYVTDTVASIGVDDVMTVTRTTEQTTLDSGPQVYDPDTVEVSGSGTVGSGPAASGGTVAALTATDIDAIAGIEGVERVEPMKNVQVDYVQAGDGTPYQLDLQQIVPGMSVELAAGTQVDLDADEPQIVLPESYVEPLGFSDAADAVGTEVTLAVTDGTGTQVTSTATVVGVAEPGLLSLGGAIPNETLTDTLFDLQTVGASEQAAGAYASASVWFDADAGDEATQGLQDRLADAGYTGATLADQLGTVTSVIDTITLVLNGFAIIALIAAAIGIVNTLLMSVQERTREVGLMKAMGLSSSTVFALFSVEAVVIGLLGSVLGVLAAMGVGQLVGVALAGSILSELPGLTLIAFAPASVAAIIGGVMAIAFLAGTLPALRAARQDPITSLRYE